jgi:fructokinase
MKTSFNVIGLGELIWDIMPNCKQLGGAPSNFAYMAGLLGDKGIIASRVGRDELGDEAITTLEALHVSGDFIQRDDKHPTGVVHVTIDERGEANFKPNSNSAWDYLLMTPEWTELARTADAVCFGTLGQRREQARETIKRFLESTRAECLRVFDVNLRHSFFTAEMLRQSLNLATIVKLSEEELGQVARLLEWSGGDQISIARKLIDQFELKLIAITRGPGGSLLVTEKETADHPGFRVEVRDTIGAGDAFTATLTHGYMRNQPLDQINDAANRVGAWVTTQVGATPRISVEELQGVIGELAKN